MEANKISNMQIMDPTLIPDQIKTVCGKTFQFLICIARDNLAGTNDSYKVANVWEGNKFMEIGNEASENTIDQISLTHSEQASLMITNGTKPYETDHSSSPTPSSKRKTESTDPNIDQSSTSRKQCSNLSTDFTEDKGYYLTKDLNEVISCEDVDQGKP
ncbi:PREDICTED: uncharacterized protein LOC104728166 [Camelina sativa]|uniref:Uncharacterized protein LOC104728166 n=1 Tax=Camelina sativa TaxID=90675 RepID=A0ABM0USE6_CAMSA|nr:PREDICTED: uncharacterized protein LOC104728166 [Camelina sativa]